MMWTEANDQELAAAAAGNRRAEVGRLASELVQHLLVLQTAFAPARAKFLMQRLRRKRLFDEMLLVGEALMQQPANAAPLVVRQYAQALIEKGELSAALSVLDALVPRCKEDPIEDAEARGLIGRVHKQRYVGIRAGARAQRAPTLQAAINAYLAVYRLNPAQNTWHGINVVALARRAARDGVALDPALDADQMATDVLAAADAAAGKDDWALVTAAEAHLALGQIDAALVAFRTFTELEQVDAFECASFLRQLEEVWELSDEKPGGALVVLARAALLKKQGAEMSLEVGGLHKAIEGISRQAQSLERVFGGARPQTVAFYQRGIERARAVARVEDTLGNGVGTGFLVRASDFFADATQLQNESLLVTNAHVVGTTYGKALRPAEAVLRFDGLGDVKSTLRVKEILFESPVGDLDATVLRLDAAVPGVEPFPLAPPEPPVLDPARRLYAIGYPEGGPLSLSMEDSLQVGWKEPRPHYRTPTAPGSSGSPICDDQWRLVALHHAGDEKMPRLDGPGEYEANEGIWIHAILGRTKAAGAGKLDSGPALPRPAFRSGIFVSYCHRDKVWLTRLATTLAPILKGNNLDLWDDRKIVTGTPWQREIEKGIESAQVAVLLVTPAFLASEFITGQEFPRIIEANRQRGLNIVWILVSAAAVEFTPLNALQAANDLKKPLDKLSVADRNLALLDIARKIHAATGLSLLKNALAVADQIGLQEVGMGGGAQRPGDMSVKALQTGSRIDITARDGTPVEVIRQGDLLNLGEEAQQLILAHEGAMRLAYSRYIEVYPRRQAADPAQREEARRQSDGIRAEVCQELNQILDFIQSMGKQLQDHYAHVRHLCR